VVGRYAIFDAIASGGMATVHLGRLIGPVGFSRTVAIKRLHPQYAHDPEFTTMFLDEARLAARVQHPNVIPTIDVLQSDSELLLVMEYVRGESLSKLVRSARLLGEKIPPRIAVAILSGALQGLHAAHEAVNEKGQPLGLVHRDMSPQNILVGVDGTARVLDFGVAKAEGRMQTTREGQVKGKLLYMPPEQLSAQEVTRTADIYSMGVVLFETLTGARMFAGETEGASVTRIMRNQIRLPSEVAEELRPFDAIVKRAVAADPMHRFASAREMSAELERCISACSPSEVGAWVERLAGAVLDDRARRVAEIESTTTLARQPSVPPPSEASRVQAAAGHRGSSKAVYAGVGVLVLLLVGAALTIAYLLGKGDNRTAPPALSASPTQTVGPALSTTAPTTGPTTAASSADPVSMPSVTRLGPTATATASAAPAHTGGGTRPPAHCDPPYTIDKAGHKHFIPECMK
jgi:serine/threonine-protein kinase